MPNVVSGHQPVYLPWLGLFHKIYLADSFIFMDDVQYLEKDWNNRNKIKTPNGSLWLTVPVSKKKSSSELLKDIAIDNSKKGTKDDWQLLHWKAINANYKKARYFGDYSSFFEEMYLSKRWENLSELNEYQLKYFMDALNVKAKVYKATELGFTKKKSELVLEHCLRLEGDICVTGIHGKDYIAEKDFTDNKIKVYYQNYVHPVYPQLWGDFIPNLSVIDLLFNCGKESLSIILRDNIKDVKNLG
ncbi:MAG: WbqC family protein [Candidatus Omnitrophica bacterium]|nr:WbqC family protein [Candidatus Omnitrophota bacterium]